MSQFIQLHILTSFPPANLNRDSLGRPKIAKMGGTDRLRVSSQSLKRTWRTSDILQSALANHLGTRTKKLGVEAYKVLVAGGIKDKAAREWAKSIAGVFGKAKKENEKNPLEEFEIEQLVHVSPAERQAIDELLKTLIEQQRAPDKEELDLLRKDNQAVDVALFGRMLASKPDYNVEAACQVAHAISVHPVVIEDDYFTAVDDLNDGSEDAGAAHIGEAGFAAGLFYLYICINRDLLMENIGGDETLAKKAIAALIEAAVKVPPQGKQNSFASRAYASYVLAETGEIQPRSLSVAFLKAIDNRNSKDFGVAAIDSLEQHCENIDKVYGLSEEIRRYRMNALSGEGNLKELLAFVTE